MIPTAISSRINICDSFPIKKFDTNKDLLIIDERVVEFISELADWKFIYKVKAGEELKELNHFPKHMEAILKTWQIPISRSSRVVACGGGSVGDFAGFVASVLKRGVVLEHIPSTWLAAIDSAHGGKTALNVGGVKNQIGTFYPAQTVHLIRNLLITQPPQRAVEGLGELVKIALIDKNLLFYSLAEDADSTPSNLLWRYLQQAVNIKNEIVAQDPYELEGLRKILNLGHTMGHVFEAHYQRSHGECVMQGLWFALEWSAHKNILDQGTWTKVQQVFGQLNLNRWTEEVDFIPMDASKSLQLLLQDKKITADKIDFVFLINIGKPVLQPVFAEEIMSEALRQGWVRG